VGLASEALREEDRVIVFENGVMRRIFGPKRDKMTGSLRKLDKEELRIMCTSPNIIRMLK
jgi:hypothetical protein